MLRVSAGREQDGRNLAVIERTMVGRIRFHGRQLCLDGKQFPLEVPHDPVHVLVGGSEGIETESGSSEHVQVHHRVDVRDVGEGTVQEVPGTGQGLLGSPEGDEEDVPPHQDAVRGQAGGQFQEHRKARGIAVGPEVDAGRFHPVPEIGVHSQVVQAGADDDVPVVQGLVPTRKETDDVAGSQRIRPFPGDAEFLPVLGGNQVDPILFQDTGHIVGRLFLALRSGLAAFQGGGRKEGYMLLQGMDRFRIIQVVVTGRTRPELGRKGGREQQQGGCEQEASGHVVTRLQGSSRPSGKFRSRAVPEVCPRLR